MDISTNSGFMSSGVGGLKRPRPSETSEESDDPMDIVGDSPRPSDHASKRACTDDLMARLRDLNLNERHAPGPGPSLKRPRPDAAHEDDVQDERNSKKSRQDDYPIELPPHPTDLVPRPHLLENSVMETPSRLQIAKPVAKWLENCLWQVWSKTLVDEKNGLLLIRHPSDLLARSLARWIERPAPSTVRVEECEEDEEDAMNQARSV